MYNPAAVACLKSSLNNAILVGNIDGHLRGTYLMKGLMFTKYLVLLWAAGLVAGCSSMPAGETQAVAGVEAVDYTYLIGPGDSVEIFVWRNPEVSDTVVVRPDGKISTPLVEDLDASGKTPTELARSIEGVLSQYIKDPLVTVIVNEFVGRFQEQVRVVGEAAEPRALPFRSNMTLLDVMIAVGGLTDFAAGNKAMITRQTDNGQAQIQVRLEDLVRDGDISANVAMRPGDILIIPEAWF